MAAHEEPEAALLAEQVAYYRARAPEYDQWWLRQGMHDMGPELNRLWQAEADEVRDALDRFGPEGDVLELAAGTGGWTKHLARHAASVTAVDASPEVLALNAARMRDSPTPVRHVQADLFDWRPDRRYDVVFFSFWITHVPPARFEPFWDLVASALAPGGRAFLVDNAWQSAGEDERSSGVSRRRLSDGREFDVVKVFWSPTELERRLAGLGWDSTFTTTERFFLHGHASLSLPSSGGSEQPAGNRARQA